MLCCDIGALVPRPFANCGALPPSSVRKGVALLLGHRLTHGMGVPCGGGALPPRPCNVWAADAPRRCDGWAADAPSKLTKDVVTAVGLVDHRGAGAPLVPLLCGALAPSRRAMLNGLRVPRLFGSRVRFPVGADGDK